MEKLHAVITGIGGYVPDYVLTNEELSRMVDTTDEWIMTRVGIKERRILKEEGLGASYMARKAVKQLLKKTGVDPETVDCVLVATTTGDYVFPTVASIICEKVGFKNAFAMDLSAACSGFLFALDMATSQIVSGRYKRIVVVAAEKMSAITNYHDRSTSPLFGDGSAAVMVEGTTEDVGVIDSILRTDGKGLPHLHMKAGGSVCPASYSSVENQMHYIHQEGQIVFKYAVSNMSAVVTELAKRYDLTGDKIDWVVPHQANLRIIDAVGSRLEVPHERIMINIEKYGNTSAVSIPLCLWENEHKLKKGDNIILTAFGAGFTWGATYLKWGYDPK